MKRLTTIICCICMMIAGAGLAINHLHELPQNTLAAANLPVDRPVPVIVGSNSLPLDIQLDLDKKASKERATSDTISSDSKLDKINTVKKKARSKKRAHITHSGPGNPLAFVIPDSLSSKPANKDMLDREEKSKEDVVAPKATSIQLIVNGVVVYSINDNHSAEEGQ
ncbi:MAG: hypothetical protein VZR53_01925 [Prevotella sp.]|nr:hypothetical protein [Prevotella sp.]